MIKYTYVYNIQKRTQFSSSTTTGGNTRIGVNTRRSLYEYIENIQFSVVE